MNETSQPVAVFMMGGPGAGKSFVRKATFPGLRVVDCDSWKQRHPEYNPKNPQAVHAWSQMQCTREFFGALSEGQSFVYDSTGTNVEKMADWMLKAQSAGFEVRLVFVRCSLQTALRRNRERARTVDEDMLRDKHSTINLAFQMLQGIADDTTTIDNEV